jgi:hypothetical protein
MRSLTTIAALCAGALSQAQIPDLLNAFDAGGRAMGMGGSTYITDSGTLSSYYNPAGLGYIRDPNVGVVFRTLPESESILTGDRANPTFDTDASVGDRAITHLGFAYPLDSGTVAFSYTTGGYVHDTRLAASLRESVDVTARNYFEVLEAKVDFYSLAYGRAQSDGLNWGAGVTLANSYVRNDVAYTLFDSDNNNLGNVITENTGDNVGIGIIAGVQYTDPDNPNLSYGASIRTPIELNGDETTETYLDRLPGRVSLGATARSNRLRNGRDFLLYSARLDYYFGGDTSGIIEREDTIMFGAGVEYNLYEYGGRWPIRVGFNYIPAGGDQFSDRNALTFGVGYRPEGNRLAVDLNLASSDGGGTDLALGLSYDLDD